LSLSRVNRADGSPPWAAGQTPHQTWYLDLSSSATASGLKS
jgi:hypothetical protein